MLLKALTMPAPKPNAVSPKGAPGRIVTAFADRVIEDIHPDVEQWNVRFNVAPLGSSRRNPHAEACTDRRGGDLNFNALPLARRIEALRRVLENPAPALARLVRLIATKREAVEAAFRPYRPPANGVQLALDDAQREIGLALNTS